MMGQVPMRCHRDLDVWMKSMELVTQIYRMTKGFPTDELYGLISQMRRSAVSIPSNIAEGAGRGSQKEFIQFLYIALGSLAELETQLQISKNLEYLDDIEDCRNMIQRIRKMIIGLMNSLKNQV